MDEEELRKRFAQLRAEDLRAEDRLGIPPFGTESRPRRRRLGWRVIAAPAALLLVALLIVTTRSHRTSFSDSDRAVVRSVAEWQAPTDFLLRTPGDEMLTTTPQIPDWKGIPR